MTGRIELEAGIEVAVILEGLTMSNELVKVRSFPAEIFVACAATVEGKAVGIDRSIAVEE